MTGFTLLFSLFIFVFLFSDRGATSYYPWFSYLFDQPMLVTNFSSLLQHSSLSKCLSYPSWALKLPTWLLFFMDTLLTLLRPCSMPDWPPTWFPSCPSQASIPHVRPPLYVDAILTLSCSDSQCQASPHVDPSFPYLCFYTLLQATPPYVHPHSSSLTSHHGQPPQPTLALTLCTCCPSMPLTIPGLCHPKSDRSPPHMHTFLTTLGFQHPHDKPPPPHGCLPYLTQALIRSSGQQGSLSLLAEMPTMHCVLL